jgi:N,N'-diacetylchitobiose transport system substrate-binding protein
MDNSPSGGSVKRKIVAVAAIAATLLGAAACGSKDDKSATTSATGAVDGKGKTLKVWLMVDAQSGWKGVVDDASKRFTDATGAQVSVEYQQWANHLTKLDATLAGSDVPDVIELGNSEFPKYVFSGAFSAVNAADYENSGTWLQGLKGACDFEGKTYCVPYYAGARVLIYRTDLFKKAGIAAAPKTYDEFLADADKLQAGGKSDAKFGAVYMPGQYWYSAMSWVKSTGGDIAKQDGDPGPAALGRHGQEVLEGRPDQERERPGRHLRPGRVGDVLRQHLGAGRRGAGQEGPERP